MDKKLHITEDDFKKVMIETLKSGTTQDEIRILIKLLMDSGKRLTYSRLLEMDATYKSLHKDYRQAFEAFEATEFSEKQKEIVETLIMRTNELAFESNLIAYESGLLDGYSILKALGVTNE